VVAEKPVSTLLASLKSNRGQRALSRSTEMSDLLPPATIIHNQPRDVEIEMETDVEIEIEMETQPFSPDHQVTVASSTLLLTPSIHQEIPQPITATPTSKKQSRDVDIEMETDVERMETETPSIQLEPPPITSTTPNTSHTNQPVSFQPDSPDAYPSVHKIHEYYVKRKVMEHGILSHDLLTFNFYEKMKLLQRMHMHFEPIVCQYGPNFKIAYVIPCRNLQIHTGSCKHMTIRLLVPQSNENEAVMCKIGK
jgi:hypothetical protein